MSLPQTFGRNTSDNTIDVTILNQHFGNKIIFLPLGGRVAIKSNATSTDKALP